MSTEERTSVSGPLAAAVLVLGPVSVVSAMLVLHYTDVARAGTIASDGLLLVGNTLFGVVGVSGFRLRWWTKVALVAAYVPAAVYLSVFPAIIIGCAVYRDCL
jgi:hypothetical protein